MPTSHNANARTDPGYKTPPFPSLYWLVGPPNVVEPAFLFYERDIWRFTFFWTLIIYEAAHLLAATYAVIIVWWGGRNDVFKIGKSREGNGMIGIGRLKKLKMLWMVPVIYGTIAGVEALLAGSVVGLM
ncbi:hypothetical protein ACLMJK_004912 [Lecanora helva]